MLIDFLKWYWFCYSCKQAKIRENSLAKCIVTSSLTIELSNSDKKEKDADEEMRMKEHKYYNWY